MVTFKSCPLELRGVANRQTKTDKVYYLLNLEDDEGYPHQFYCPDVKALPSGLCKGDMVVLTCAYSVYDRQERLTVTAIEKVD